VITAILGLVLIALLLLGNAALKRYFEAREAFDILAEDEREHVIDLGRAEDLSPALVFVPDGFTCLECKEAPALPHTVWCAVCNRAAWAAIVAPSSPIWGKP
jgi:hypothetical protein